MELSLETPLRSLKGAGTRMPNALAKLGIHTVRDLLWHFPARYDDFVAVVPIAELEGGTQTTIMGRVIALETRRSFRKKLTITEATLEDATGTVHATWFNPYIASQLGIGTEGYFAGKVIEKDGLLVLTGPVFERSRETGDQRHTGRLVPIYPETKGITSRGIRYLVMPILQELGSLPDPLPTTIAEAQGFAPRLEALRAIHFPDTREAAAIAKQRFIFEELFLLQLTNALARAELAKVVAPKLAIPLEHLKELIAALPFELTKGQKEALWDIVQDIEKTHPMNRLVQGDVGSGKTIVSVLAAHITFQNEKQAALMAPTDILARQHFETFAKAQGWFEHTDKLPTVALLSGNHGEILYPEGLRTIMKPAKIREGIAQGKVDIAIGTHALISGSTTFKNLGLVVIDEQHRFGVAQRQALTEQHTQTPHFLSMTATPIPRTVMLAAFGDLSSSRITEMPSGRKPVHTTIVQPEDRDAMYSDIEKELMQGRQAFVVCPLIEHLDPNEAISATARAKREAMLEAQSVAQVAEAIKAALPNHSVTTLHGKMKADEKKEVMHAFSAGTIDILVATTVIEVGVDVPNASVMVVESAERFGLAQLHQLRGRIGRGGHAGTCYLVTESNTIAARKRLQVLEKTNNGFVLAEYDLKLRGPGEFIGTSQSGIPDLAMEHLTNTELIETTREAVSQALAEGLITTETLREINARKKAHGE